MRIPIYQVDAFTDRLFGENPISVCPLEVWLDEEMIQNIAAEDYLSETSFYVKKVGELFCQCYGDRVYIGGRASTYLIGVLR